MLSILNGGVFRRLENLDINYYYNNMDKVIALINGPLATYTKVQKQIAGVIKKIGGSGYIHGCIIDIDYWNHIYVNPYDSKLTGYWAHDVVNKIVYADIPSLLEDKCPWIYSKYVEQIDDNIRKLLIPRNTKLSKLKAEYNGTDIYVASREIKKLQKIKSNILTTWSGIIDNNTALPNVQMR